MDTQDEQDNRMVINACQLLLSAVQYPVNPVHPCKIAQSERLCRYFDSRLTSRVPGALSTWFRCTLLERSLTSLLDIYMQIGTWNLRHNAGVDVWPRLWSTLNLDILCLQETARPDTQFSQFWELVPGNNWGSAVVLASGAIAPIEIPNYRGWVVGGEVHESNLQTDGRRMFVFSLHSPHRSTPFHCDGIFVPNRWMQRVTCEVFTSECYRISDHNPVVAWIAN